MNIPDGALVIPWCYICNAEPSDGKLDVYINKYDSDEPDLKLGIHTIDACQKCVDNFEVTDWHKPQL